mmetsp:Transcript_121129/g.339194  ORF Transcript_121129/g.339194 Transcript_121129/m.339194 type:complete len:237 (-) Transcript_121129:227-937(-)
MALSLKPPSATHKTQPPSFRSCRAQCSTLPGFKRSPEPSAPQSAFQRLSLHKSGYHWSLSWACQSSASPVSVRNVKPKPRKSRPPWPRRCWDQAPGPPQRSKKQDPRGTPSSNPTAAQSSASLSPARFSWSLPPSPLWGNIWARATRVITLRASGGGSSFQRSSSRAFCAHKFSTSSLLQNLPPSKCSNLALSTRGSELRGSNFPEERRGKLTQFSSKGRRTARPPSQEAAAKALK